MTTAVSHPADNCHVTMVGSGLCVNIGWVRSGWVKLAIKACQSVGHISSGKMLGVRGLGVITDQRDVSTRSQVTQVMHTHMVINTNQTS